MSSDDEGEKEKALQTVTGYVDHIVFRNEENGYTVFHLDNDDGEVTCVGNFNFISEGEMMELEGEYVNHNVYGSQFRVSSYQMKEPEDLVSIERYLGSGAVKGVGAALAGRIVRKFKEDTFRIIEQEPERLAEIKGISERKAREIAVQVEEKGYAQGYDLSAEIRDLDRAGRKDIPSVWDEALQSSGGKSISAGGYD